MTTQSSVIDALSQALASAPEDVALRLHLAKVLLDSNRAAEAHEHFSYALKRDPVNIEALEGARASAEAIGESNRANGYATLLRSLGRHVEAKQAEPEEPTDAEAAAPPVSVRGKPELRVVGGSDIGNGTDLADEPDRVDVTLADVAGLGAVKRRIEVAFLGPLRNPAMAKAYGKRMRGGLLLYGPPGCGKTYIARALAGELKAGFMSIGLSDVLNMWLGESEQRLHALFERARQNAPTVIFMDELDALGRKRSDLRHSGVREVVNQLLQELDGVSTQDSAVFVLGATNLPWDIDGALKRPGRFDRAIFVEPPDSEARERILELNLAGRPTDGVDLGRIAKRTRGFSGADLAFLCEMATESTLERAMKTGRVEPITSKELERALKEIRPSIASWFETARNYAMFANASGEFNDLAEYIEQNRI